MNILGVILLILAVRLSSVFVVRTYFVPDEYWQSLEVAHKLTFGYGHLTWEWAEGIRSYIYPLVFAAVYKLLALLQLESAQTLVLVPRILQALLSAYSDYRFFVWTGKRKWALFVVLVAWFWFYMGSRTLTNTLETSLTTIALSYYPWNGEGTGYLWLAGICSYLRPTAAVIWIPLAINHLRKSRLPWTELALKRFLVIGLAIAAACVGIDSYMYGRLIVTPYEFLKYNVLYNIGSFYGSHPWYWYFTVGLPTVLGITFVPFIFGVTQTLRKGGLYPPIRKQLLTVILLSLIVLSTVEHKEFRFVTSLLPLCLYITSDTLTRWSYSASRVALWLCAFTILLGNAVPALYLSTVHQAGPLELMPKLQKIAHSYRDEQNNRASILYLMPCHSTPFYSHIHENITMRILTCEPNLKGKATYADEAEQFYRAPMHWLRSHLPVHPRTALPSHVVLFEPLAPKIHDFLLNYKLVDHVNNPEGTDKLTYQQLLDDFLVLLKQKNLSVDSRRGRNINIYERRRAEEMNDFNRKSPEQIGEIDEDLILNANEGGREGDHNLFN